MSVLLPYIFSLVRVVAILIIAYVATKITSRLILGMQRRMVELMEQRALDHLESIQKRAATIGGLLGRGASALIWTMAVIMGLREVGFDIGPLLAGAGVAGLAIGFGAQNLVRDVVSGFFMLMEDQIRVGDVAEINGTGGLVEQVNLRTTVLRGLDGTVHVFPNGSVNTLSNLTMGFSFYVFDMGVAYKEDTDHVIKVMREVARKMLDEEEFKAIIVEPLEVLGVDRFADSAVVIKARVKTRPGKQWTVGRELNRRFKQTFDELGIEIPFPHVSVYVGEASKPFRLLPGPENRDELKAAIREVLAEARESK